VPIGPCEQISRKAALKDFQTLLDDLEAEIMDLAKPHTTRRSHSYFRPVITARRAVREASKTPAQFCRCIVGRTAGFVSARALHNDVCSESLF